MKPYYEHNGITIYHGDCLEIMPQLEPVDLVLTDPPYGVGKAEWDNFLNLQWLAVAKKKTVNIAFTSGHKFMYKYPEPDCLAAAVRAGSTQLQKKGGGFSHWEPILIYGEKLPNPDMVQIPANTKSGFLKHPCPKSEQLFKWILIKLTSPSETILDPFMGSGTTLVAAKQLGRKAIGIEIERAYCDIAIKRLQQEVLPFSNVEEGFHKGKESSQFSMLDPMTNGANSNEVS